ncbi:MAG: flagellar protein FlaG [Desulfuromonadales bacterium]|nr:flagellar protein FlaG [Desulfuromonadales bacterium]MBN2792070.1 flagellar protein FlaG [Desulfuromonadales bacterium]
MNVEAINTQSAAQFQLSKASDQLSEARKVKSDPDQSEKVEKKLIQPEELLQQIKSLTEEGLYSVRFENDERAGMVVKIVDRENDEVIRQVPAEEILELKATLEDLRGNLIDTEG